MAKEEIAASVGHELNNYLAIISSNAEMLLVNLQKNAWDKVTQNVEAVLETTAKMKRFTDSLMEDLTEQAEILKPGAYLITFTKGIKSSRFKVPCLRA